MFALPNNASWKSKLIIVWKSIQADVKSFPARQIQLESAFLRNLVLEPFEHQSSPSSFSLCFDAYFPSDRAQPRLLRRLVRNTSFFQTSLFYRVMSQYVRFRQVVHSSWGTFGTEHATERSPAEACSVAFLRSCLLSFLPVRQRPFNSRQPSSMRSLYTENDIEVMYRECR